MSGKIEYVVKECIKRTDADPLPINTVVDTVSEDSNILAGQILLADVSGGAITLTLPKTLQGSNVTIKKIAGTGNNAVNIETKEDGEIDGNSSITITNQYTSRELVSDGEDWYIK